MIKNMMNLEGDLLVAMPNMTDPRFSKAVIYICAHTEDGAMGVVINKPVENVAFNELLEQIGFSSISPKDHIRVYFGGPVESARGFVLHSTDYIDDSTLVINKQFALTSTIDVIKALANGAGPSESILALGYAGWEAGQLDDEILSNGWLTVPADKKLVFETNNNEKWQSSTQCIGIDPNKLSGDSGRA